MSSLTPCLTVGLRCISITLSETRLELTAKKIISPLKVLITLWGTEQPGYDAQEKTIGSQCAQWMSRSQSAQAGLYRRSWFHEDEDSGLTTKGPVWLRILCFIVMLLYYIYSCTLVLLHHLKYQLCRLHFHGNTVISHPCCASVQRQK